MRVCLGSRIRGETHNTVRALAGPRPRLPTAGAGNSDARRAPSFPGSRSGATDERLRDGKQQDAETGSWESGVGWSGNVFTRRACLRSDLKQRKEPTVRDLGEEHFRGHSRGKGSEVGPVLQIEGQAGLVSVERRVWECGRVYTGERCTF